MDGVDALFQAITPPTMTITSEGNTSGNHQPERDFMRTPWRENTVR